MQKFNIHEAKTRFSYFIDNAVKGNGDAQKKRIGFMKDKISVPADFDSMGKKEIENLFEGANEKQGRHNKPHLHAEY